MIFRNGLASLLHPENSVLILIVHQPHPSEKTYIPFSKRGFTMKTMILNSFGGPESFELFEVPKPVPHAGQVLVVGTRNLHQSAGLIMEGC